MQKQNYPLQLILSAIAVSSTLLWLFIGRDITYAIFPYDIAPSLYIFFSGTIFSLGLVGAYAFIHSLLFFTDFIKNTPDQSTQINELILDRHKDALFYKSISGQYLYASNYAPRILKLGDRDIINQTDQQLHKPLIAHKIEMEDKRVIENGEKINWQTSLELNNQLQHYQCEKSPARNEQGEIVGINGYCENITIKKALQQQVNKVETRYQALFNKLPYPVVIIDMGTMLPFRFNDALCKLLKYDADTISRKSFSSHVVMEQQNQFKELLIKTHRSDGNEFELSLNNRDKDIIDVTGFAQQIKFDNKNYLHLLLRDVTESKKSTNELIGSELKYRSLFEHASDAIIIVDIHSLQIIDANEIALEKLGYNRDTLAAMTLFDLDATRQTPKTREQLKNLEIYNHVLYEHCITNRNGNNIDVEINAHKVNYGHQEVYQFVIRDINQRKHIENALRESEQRYRQMFESNQAIKLVINPQTHIIENANPAAAEFYGYELDELEGMHIAKINVLPIDKLDILIHQSQQQHLGFYNCPHKLANGDIRFVEVREGPLEVNGRTLTYAIIHDITAGKQAEDKLILASKMFDHSTDAAIITDEHNRILSVNHAFTDITGYQQSEVQGFDPASFLSEKNDRLITDEIEKSLDEFGYWHGEIWYRQQDGSTFPLDMNIHIIKSSGGDIINYVILLSPIHGSLSDNEISGNYSPLTHLPNKALYLDRLNYALERNQRNKKVLAVLMIDFRNFSQINQQYGYDTGDRILQSIARRLKYSIRESDTIAHLDSDNFVLLLEDLVNIQQAGIVAQKIISTLSESYQIDEHDIQLEASIGISISPDDGVDASELMDKAQQALHSAQSQAGNIFRLSSNQLDQHAHTWLQTEEKLLKALKQNEFVNVYQAIYDTKNKNTIIAIETLLRWQHPQHGELLPAEFLPNAERSGFISAIAADSFAKAFLYFSRAQAQNSGLNKLWLNISLAQINDDLPDMLIQLCQQYNIQHSQVALDFNEHKLLNCSGQDVKIIQQLQQHDFYLCIDNFGSVGASLECLLQCPPSAIKIDRSFIQRSNQPQAGKMLQALSVLAQKLEIDVIAEGIETREQFEHMKDNHIYLMQGYYFSQPLKADELTQLIQQTNGSSHETS